MFIHHLRSVSWKHVQIQGDSWGPRVQTNRDVVLDYQYE